MNLFKQAVGILALIWRRLSEEAERESLPSSEEELEAFASAILAGTCQPGNPAVEAFYAANTAGVERAASRLRAVGEAQN
jgi:hypothetical protein